MPAWLAALDETIRRKIRSKRGGMPDVVGWNDHESLYSALFVECKGPTEAFAEAQEDWVWGALVSGVSLSQIAVSVRPF
jgi:VRR-NUC domain